MVACCITGCSGPERGWFAEARGRTQARHDALDADAPLPSDQDLARLPLFPLFYAEASSDGHVLEQLWPLFESGRGPRLPWGRPRWFRLRPVLWVEQFHGQSRLVVFPFFYHLRQELEAGDRAIDHFWPLYGLHRETIDLAPAVTHHFLWPLGLIRHGPERWKVRLLPLLDGSHGYIDRGWWLLPVLKWGGHGQSEFFYLLDPLFSYERDSIAPGAAEETPTQRRLRIRLLGGLLGWEDDRGRRRLQILWWLKL